MSVSDNRVARAPRQRSWLPAGVTLVALVMIVGFTLFVIKLMGTIEQLDSSLNALRARVGGAATMLGIVGAEETRRITLTSPSHRSDLRGTVFLNERGNVAMFWNHDGGGTERYVLWRIDGADTTNLGFLDRQAADTTFWVLGGFGVGDATGRFLITREPENEAASAQKEVMVSSR